MHTGKIFLFNKFFSRFGELVDGPQNLGQSRHSCSRPGCSHKSEKAIRLTVVCEMLDDVIVADFTLEAV